MPCLFVCTCVHDPVRSWERGNHFKGLDYQALTQGCVLHQNKSPADNIDICYRIPPGGHEELLHVEPVGRFKHRIRLEVSNRIPLPHMVMDVRGGANS